MSEPSQNLQPAPDETAVQPAWVALPPALRAELFDPESWYESLDAYAGVTHLAVALVDVEGRRLGTCINPQPIWSLLHAYQAAAGRGCPFALASHTPCTCVRDALAARKLVLARDRTGLVHFTVPLVLDDHPLGALLAGQVFDQYPEEWLLEHIAKHCGLPPGAVWQRARLEPPVKRATLYVYGRLLATLGQAFLHTRYHTIMEASRRAELEGVNAELRRTQMGLAAARDRYSDLYNLAPIGYLILDAAGRILEANLTAATLLGVARDQLLGQPLARFVGAEDQDTFSLHRQRVLADGSPQSCELPMRRANGTSFYARLESRAGQDETGHPTHCRTVLSDITARQQLEAHLLQTQKMEALGTLAGGIAHDFNNVLMAISGHTELALTAVPQASMARHHLQGILVAGKRAADLVQQILTFSRHSMPQRQLLPLGPLVQETLGLLRASLPSTIDIRTHLHATSDTVLANPTQLQQVLLNLGSNAAHAMRATGGVLELRLDEVDDLPASVASHPELQPGPYLRLTVQDTGAGMAPEVVARIFEPFFTTKGPGEGTGLGLALVHGIVTSHGGTLTVTSGLGQGTTFTMYLPRMQGEVAVVARVEEPLPKGQERIMCVDDEEAVADVMQALLTSLGYEVQVYTNSLDALAAFRAAPQHFDLVVTDRTMPAMTGETLAGELRRIRADIPIILCTGYGSRSDPETGDGVGIDAVLMKPVASADLARTIRQVFAQHQAQGA